MPLFTGLTFSIITYAPNDVEKASLMAKIEENGGTYIEHPVNIHDWNRLTRQGIVGVWIALVDPEVRNWNQQALEQSVLMGHRNQHYESSHGRVTVFYQNWGALEICLHLDIRIASRSAQSRLILNRSPTLEGWRIFLSKGLRPVIDFSELIERHGGQVIEAIEDAHIAIMDLAIINELAEKYDKLVYPKVETIEWLIETVTRRRVVCFTPIRGRSPVATFSLEDDHNLRAYLDQCISIGNTALRGDHIYKTLVCKEDDWVKRHSWRCWRKRYLSQSSDAHPSGILKFPDSCPLT